MANKVYALNRTRDHTRGEIIDLRLSDYVQCIHSRVGHARLNMEILIIEYEDTPTTNSNAGEQE